jgi:exopolysaccharide biosynthesis polyprenyl glycosylphosphotransferase
MNDHATRSAELGFGGRARSLPRISIRSNSGWRRLRVAVDLVLLASAASISTLGEQAVGSPTGPVVSGAFVALVLLSLSRRGQYALRVRLDSIEEWRAIFSAALLASTTILTVSVVLGADGGDVVRQLVRLTAFATVYMGAGRVALGGVQRRSWSTGASLAPTLIVGAGKVGRLTARRLLEHPEFGLRPVGFLDREPLEESGARSVVLPVLGSSWDLEEVVERLGVEQVIIAFSTAPNDVMLRLARRCEECGVAVALVPRLFEQVTDRVSVEHLGGLPLLVARPSDPRSWRFALKHALDRVMAAVGLILVSPLLLLAAAAVLVSTGRPILFRQPRVGRDGRLFEMLKFRSMRPPVDGPEVVELAPDTAPGGVEGDDRRTGVGALLRNTSIDELPQLFNVLRGEMSIIGPRPERPEFVELFEQQVYRYGDRHRVKSGITGWAQVHGLRGQTSLADRVEWDNYYIENWSLWLDFKILLLTARIVFGFGGRAE